MAKCEFYDKKSLFWDIGKAVLFKNLCSGSLPNLSLQFYMNFSLYLQSKKKGKDQESIQSSTTGLYLKACTFKGLRVNLQHFSKQIFLLRCPLKIYYQMTSCLGVI